MPTWCLPAEGPLTPARFSVCGSYNPASIPSNRSAQGQYYSVVVGAYDKHAIEYGYSAIEVEMEQPGRQPPQLQAIAARGASRHELAFATDEDGPRSDGADPFTVSCASGGTGRSASV